MNNKAFFKISYGLYLVSTCFKDHYSACIANTFMQMTDQPKKICFALNKKNYTTELLLKSKVVNIGILPDHISLKLINDFGMKSGRDVDKFKDKEYFRDKDNIKQIYDIVAYFHIHIDDIKDEGTHYLFTGNVDEAEMINDVPVLTYEHYHQRKPKKGFRCRVCGFIYEGDYLPDNYECPICHVDASFFDKI